MTSAAKLVKVSPNVLVTLLWNQYLSGLVYLTSDFSGSVHEILYVSFHSLFPWSLGGKALSLSLMMLILIKVGTFGTLRKPCYMYSKLLVL